MGSNIEIETRVKDQVGIIDISGEVTSYSEEALQQSYEKLTALGLKKIALNFEKVAYINSAGMAVIIGILTRSRKKGQTLRAWGLSEHFQKIFDMVGITKYMEHFMGESDALKGF